MLSCFGEKRDYTRLLRETTFHQSPADSIRRISRDDVLIGHLTQSSDSTPPGEHLSFCSLVEITGGKRKHIPLLDFHCPETCENDKLVSEVCKQITDADVLLFSSGESYHALGLELLEEDGLRRFLTRSLLFAPIVDSRYVAHQLLEGACALRLSYSATKPTRPWLKLLARSTSQQ